MKMTLSEIKSKVPELQTKIADLVKLNADSNQRLAEIDAELADANDILDNEKKTLDSINAYIKSKSDPSKKIQGYLKVQEQKKKESEAKIKVQKGIIKKLEDEKKDITKPDSDYSKRAAELQSAKAELDEICDILVQDPTINYHMQTAVMDKFDNEIESKKKEKADYEKATKDIGGALKDDSADGLKTLVEEMKKAKEELDESLEDPAKDSNAAKAKHLDAKKKLVDQVQAKYGIKLKPADISAMIAAMDSGKEDELTLPSVEEAIKTIDETVTKLEEAKATTLTRLESKKVVTAVVDTPEMEANQKDIDRITGEIGGLDTELADIDTQLEELNNQIKDKEKKLGDPSEDYVELKDSEENLKKNHLIIDEMVPDLEDPKSDLSKKYNEFEKADLAVRKAFQEAKGMRFNESEDGKDAKISSEDGRKELIENLQKAIENYKTISEELASMSGFDIESWQNFLQYDLNGRDLGELDSAYYHTNNQNFKDMLDDKEAMNNGKAIDEYDDVEESLSGLDKAQKDVLNGKFDISLDDLFMDKDKGYFSRLDKFQEASGFKKGKDGLFPNVSIYDLLRKNSMIEKSPLNRIKGFFKRIAQKIRPQKPFNMPEENQEAFERYVDARTPEVEKEIEERKGLEDLIKQRDALIAKRDAKTSERIGKDVELAQAQERQEELAKSAPTTSKIEATELEFRKVTHKDDIIRAAVEREEEKAKDDDEGR